MPFNMYEFVGSLPILGCVHLRTKEHQCVSVCAKFQHGCWPDDTPSVHARSHHPHPRPPRLPRRHPLLLPPLEPEMLNSGLHTPTEPSHGKHGKPRWGAKLQPACFSQLYLVQSSLPSSLYVVVRRFTHKRSINKDRPDNMNADSQSLRPAGGRTT